MNAELRVENLKVNDILKDVNFDLKSGTMTALIGPTGAGKTTLLKTLFGLVKYQGNIIINGIIMNSNNECELRKNIGIFLETNILEGKNVFFNLVEPLINLGYEEEKCKKRIYEITKKLDIEKLLYKEIETLSYSQRKVILFTKSIVHYPSIILIDDLFDSLDIYYKEKVLNFINYLKNSKKSLIVFTTKNSEEILLSDNLIFIKNGKVLSTGETKNLLENENLFSKNNTKLPFIVELSNKLKSYGLIEKLMYDMDEMVDEIWK